MPRRALREILNKQASLEGVAGSASVVRDALYRRVATLASRSESLLHDKAQAKAGRLPVYAGLPIAHYSWKGTSKFNGTRARIQGLQGGALMKKGSGLRAQGGRRREPKKERVEIKRSFSHGRGARCAQVRGGASQR